MRDPAALFHSLSDASRLRLLRLLVRQELNVQELVAVTGLAQPRVSRHLAVLREQGWLRQRREGTWNWYRTVAAETFPFGADAYRQLTVAADQVAEAADDDRALAEVMAHRERGRADFFAGLAARWDSIRREYDHPDITLGTVSALVPQGLCLLDIGTGTGAMLPPLAAAAARVVALDHSPAMLRRAQELRDREGLTHVDLCNGTLAALPFADEAFDACHCAMALHHVAEPAAAVAEMARVVRPGGEVMITAFCPHEETWMRDELAHNWLGFARETVEEYCVAAGLVPGSYLVRSRLPHARGGRPPGGAKRPRWPDVFLATATRPAGGEPTT